MTAWPANPVVNEVFTWVWLADLSRDAGHRVDLATVPAEVWDEIAGPGVDAVWLMGVWQRSPIGAQIARAHPAMSADARAALNDLSDADVVGSAYCIRGYTVDPALGGEAGLAAARAALAERGARLMLDLVPNHVAPDHPWVREHPEYFVHGSVDDLAHDPSSFVDVDGIVFALGRDPYFAAWPEVLQLDASRNDLRGAMVELVDSLATRCDGVRCDMAMLMLDDVFARTWGERATGDTSPGRGPGYWPTVITAIKAEHPDFLFIAEAYWDLEPVLVEQGFDACYDKRLYDRIVHAEPTSSIRAHLGADPAYQQHTVRFVENHDEPRAASLLSSAAHRAALTAVLTLPGVALLHEGELDGRRVRVPVTLGRRPAETLDSELHADADRLIAALAGGLRRGQWALAPVDGWPDNRSCDRLIAWTWTSSDQRHLVVINLSGERADGMVRLPWPDLAGRSVDLDELLSGARFERDGQDIVGVGLYVSLDGWGVHLLQVH